jgi:hypothetical protein
VAEDREAGWEAAKRLENQRGERHAARLFATAFRLHSCARRHPREVYRTGDLVREPDAANPHVRSTRGEWKWGTVGYSGTGNRKGRLNARLHVHYRATPRLYLFNLLVSTRLFSTRTIGSC